MLHNDCIHMVGTPFGPACSHFMIYFNDNLKWSCDHCLEHKEMTQDEKVSRADLIASLNSSSGPA